MRAARRAAPPVPRLRRRRLAPIVRRAAIWALPVILAAGAYGAVMLSRLPTGQAIFDAAAERALAATAALGLIVSDIQVEGRETTDAATILAALKADRGTPIL